MYASSEDVEVVIMYGDLRERRSWKVEEPKGTVRWTD